MENREQIGPGFYKGNNHVRRKFMCTLAGEQVAWKPFLFYIAKMFTITKYDEDSFELVIITKNQLEIFYKKVKHYNGRVEERNYETARNDGDAWKKDRISQTEDAVIASILK